MIHNGDSFCFKASEVTFSSLIGRTDVKFFVGFYVWSVMWCVVCVVQS